MDWTKVNEHYWDDVSNSYENLYTDKWSFLEDEFIQTELVRTITRKDKVLDLGCGLCLGYYLLKDKYSDIDYIGVDLSENMLKKAYKKNNSLKLINSKMSDLSKIPDKSIDVIISINTSFSFTDDISKTISEIKRVLKQNGRVFISVLSQWSLRRIVNGKFGNTERYSTRNASKQTHSFVWVFSKAALIKVFKTHGFNAINVQGYNALATLLPIERVWRINLYISQMFPNLSHDLILTAKYNE